MKIALIFNQERKDTLGIYFARALKELGYEFDHFWTKDANSIKEKYSLYLRIDHGDYKYDIPHHLHPAAFYVVDTNIQDAYQKIKRQIGHHYDFVFCVQRTAALEFRNKGVNAFWMPLACDPHVHCRLNLPKRYDIGFVGNDGGVPRKFILQELRERYPVNFIGNAPFTKIKEIYSQAKIGFNFIPSQTRHTQALGMRFFEILSCGAMLLTNYSNAENLNLLGFHNREHLVLYKDFTEIFPLIEYYLKNERKREEIAENGYRLAIEKHTYTHRVREMIKIVNVGV